MKTKIHQNVLHCKYISQKLNGLATAALAAAGGLTGFQEHLARSKFLNISQNVSHDSSAALWLIGRGLWQNQKTVYASFKILYYSSCKKLLGFFPLLKWLHILLSRGLKVLCNSQNQTWEWMVGNKPFSRFFFCQSTTPFLLCLPRGGCSSSTNLAADRYTEHTQECTGHHFQFSISLSLQLARFLLEKNSGKLNI